MPNLELSAKPKETFWDFDMNMTVNPVTGDLMLKTTEDAIKQSVKNLVLTNFYERPHQPQLGSQVTGVLFENYSYEIEIFLKREITRVIRQNEPRVELLEVKVGHDGVDSVRIVVFFVIIGRSQRSTLELFFERVR
jgi:phage baseplate assembly protein W